MAASQCDSHGESALCRHVTRSSESKVPSHLTLMMPCQTARKAHLSAKATVTNGEALLALFGQLDRVPADRIAAQLPLNCHGAAKQEVKLPAACQHWNAATPVLEHWIRHEVQSFDLAHAADKRV